MISGLLISSVQNSSLVESLGLILKPKAINVEQVRSLTPSQKQILLVGYKNDHENYLEWTSAQHTKLIKREIKSLAISGLAAFPLPIWPFFGKNPTLNAMKHFADYISAYHPEVKCLQYDLGMVAYLNSTAGVFRYSTDLTRILMAVADNEGLEVSAYCERIGLLVLREYICSSSSPVRAASSNVELHPLQYSGHLFCRQEAWASDGYYFELLYYTKLPHVHPEVMHLKERMLRIFPGSIRENNIQADFLMQFSLQFVDHEF